MARRKTPETSALTRMSPGAYVRKQKGSAPDDNSVLAEDDASVKDKDVAPKDAPKEPKDPKEPKEPKADKAKVDTSAPEAVTQPQRSRVDTVGMPIEAMLGKPPDMPVPEVAAPTVTVPARSPAPPPAHEPVDRPDRQDRPETATAVEQPTRMPGPRDIPPGDPGEPAPPPGAVPKGDSRSLRRAQEFALIYRQANAVISRFGTVGTRGQWRGGGHPPTPP